MGQEEDRIHQKINQKEITKSRGLVSLGSSRIRVVYFENKDSTKIPNIGDFVMFDTESKRSGLVVKKTDKAESESIGMVVANTKGSSALAISEGILTIAPMNEGIEVYVESAGAIKRGEALKLKVENGKPHKVEKNDGKKQIGIALENANQGDMVLVMLRSF